MFTSRHIKHSRLLLRHARKYLRYKHDKLSDVDREQIVSEMQILREALRSRDRQKIHSAAQTLEYMCAERMDDNGRFCIDTIIKASERMEELLEAMLLLARISRSELELEEVDLSTLAMDNILRLHLQERNRVVEHQVASEVTVMGDARLLKSALENLLGNAWKYTRKEAVTRIEFGVTTIDGERPSS